MRLRVTTALATLVAAAGMGLGMQAAPATAKPAPIPPRAFPIPHTHPKVTFSTEQSRLVFKVTDLPRGEKICLFEGYYGDPLFGSLGVRSWQALYEKYELGTWAKARSTPKPPGTYPVRLICRMQEHLLVNRYGTVRIPASRR